VGIAETDASDPTALIRLPVPSKHEDPQGVRMLGWVITSQAIDQEVRFLLGQNTGKTATVKIPVEKRNENLSLQIVASTDGKYAITFRTVAYYTVDTILVAGQEGVMAVDLELPSVPTADPVRRSPPKEASHSSAGRK